MRHHFRFVVVLCWLLVVTTALAQTPDLEAVEVDGVKHMIYHDGASPVLSETRATIQAIVPDYAALWAGETPTIVVDLLPLPGVDAEGVPLALLHSWREQISVIHFTFPADTPEEVCYINVYSAPDALTDYAFLLAQEIAQCFMFYNVPIATAPGFEFGPFHGWWGEGAARWMAFRAFGIFPEDWIKTQEAFLDGRGDTTVKIGEGAFYFWHIYAELLGEDSLIAFIKNMPDDVNAHPDYINTTLETDPDAFMHDYALAAGKLEIPGLPFAEDMFHVEVPEGGLPGEVKVSIEPFGIDLLRVNIAGLAPGEGLFIEATDLERSGVRISLLDGRTIGGEPVKICPTDGKVHFAASRAGLGDDLDPPWPAILKFERTDPCDPTPAPDTGIIPACMVGTWIATNFPDIPGMPAAMSGELQITLNPDGTTLTTYSDFTQTTNVQDVGEMSLTINGTASGQITVDSDGRVTPAGDTTYSLTATANIGGMTMDMTDMVSSIAGVSLGIPPAAVLTCAPPDGLIMEVTASGNVFRYAFDRVES